MAKKSPSEDKPKVRVRDVIYDKVEAKICMGKTSLTMEQAKKLLGWQEESENIKFGNDYLFKDLKGNKIICHNNLRNRPLYGKLIETYQQEILRRRWRFNGEPIIIGKTGLVLNGQHTLIALVFAFQDWEEHGGKWKDFWQTPPTISKLVMMGIEEDDDVVNTMDTCKPRSLADVVFRSEYFADFKKQGRKRVASMLDHAVRMLWHRTGASHNAFAPLRTHAESLGFIERHPTLLKASLYIYEENDKDNRIGRFISPGYAAALMYLMGCSTTDQEKGGKGYGDVEDPTESLVNWERWDKAQEFWVLLASGETSLDPVREAIGQMLEDGYGARAERCAVLVKAWNLFASGKVVKQDAIELKYSEDGEGYRTLAETPIVGGIDIGGPSAR